jgi:hypothetical protein
MPGSADALRRIRRIALAIPEVTETVSHGAPTFWARGKKTFATFADDHHGDGRIAVWCATPPGGQQALIAGDPERFFYPAYVGHRGWVGMRVDVKPDWKLIASVLQDAHDAVEATLPKPRVARARQT